MDSYRIEHDSMGEVRVPANHLWGAQTQRSLENFKIGIEKMPKAIIRAFAILKKCCAEANSELNPKKMTSLKLSVISAACDEILNGKLSEEFPLAVWQTGSGTQSNMNVNEVIANRGNQLAGKKILHPNDDVNMSQSSNDTFPAAIHIAAVCETQAKLLPALCRLKEEFLRLEKENEGILKCGRTHLQDAVPIRFSQEISGWRALIERSEQQIITSLDSLSNLSLGGTAVGTGLNAPKGFDVLAADKISVATGYHFRTDENKFHSLSAQDEAVFAHGALKALAADLMKIANDIRLLASGPRTGLGEISIPANEPGSSIMPGKVNPTQCEAVTMVAVQVMGNDAAIGFAASQGNFQLNVFLPVIAYNYLQSVQILSDVMNSFCKNCVAGIKPNIEKMTENVNKSLMLAAALNPSIGYENAAKTVKLAFEKNITLKEAATELGFLSAEEFDRVFKPEEMT